MDYAINSILLFSIFMAINFHGIFLSRKIPSRDAYPADTILILSIIVPFFEFYDSMNYELPFYFIIMSIV